MSKPLTEEQKERKRIKRKEYNAANADKIKEQNRIQKEKRKEKNKELDKIRYEKNKDLIKERVKKYKENNKEKIKKTDKIRYENNKEKIKKQKKKYEENNKEKIRKIHNDYVLNRLKKDPIYKMIFNIRTNIRKNIKKIGLTKNTKTTNILGCSFIEFREYLESKFETWMNWDNYGNPKDGLLEPNKSWDIDHIKPLKLAINEEEVIKLNHYTNMQPLCSYQNRIIKKDKY